MHLMSLKHKNTIHDLFTREINHIVSCVLGRIHHKKQYNMYFFNYKYSRIGVWDLDYSVCSLCGVVFTSFTV
jgi:hypothetical protein